jgi:hypothetical protein
MEPQIDRKEFRTGDDEPRHTVAELIKVMEGAGFSDKITKHYRKDFSAAQRASNPDNFTNPQVLIDELYAQYHNIKLSMDLMARYSAGSEAYRDLSPEMLDEIKNSIIDDESYNVSFQTDFDLLRVCAIEMMASDEATDPKRLRDDAEGLGLTADAQAGYWITNTALSVFLIDPSLRSEICSYVNNKNRKRILGDDLSAKLESAERLLDIIDSIDDGVDGAELIKINLTNRLGMIMEYYESVKGDIGLISQPGKGQE